MQVLFLSDATVLPGGDKEVHQPPVSVRIVQDALSFFLVAARPATLLDVALERLGH